MTALVALVWLAAQTPDPPPPPAPPPSPALLAELARFHLPQLAADFNRGIALDHYEWVKANAALNADRWWWHDYQREARRRYDCWHWLTYALAADQAEGWRWYYLECLAAALGDPRLFEAGVMPRPMPCLDAPDGRR